MTAKSRDDRTRENRAANQKEAAISALVKKEMTSIDFNQIQLNLDNATIPHSSSAIACRNSDPEEADSGFAALSFAYTPSR